MFTRKKRIYSIIGFKTNGTLVVIVTLRSRILFLIGVNHLRHCTSNHLQHQTVSLQLPNQEVSFHLDPLCLVCISYSEQAFVLYHAVFLLLTAQCKWISSFSSRMLTVQGSTISLTSSRALPSDSSKISFSSFFNA